MRLVPFSLFGLFSSSALAGTLVVPNQYADLPDAVQNAGCGDTIVLMAGTWSPPGQDLVCDVTIRGAGSSSTVINGWGTGRDTLSVTNAIGFNIEGVTVVGASGFTPIDVTASTGTFDDVAMVGQSSSPSAMQVQNSAITIANSYFSDNSSSNQQAAHLYITLNSDVTVTNTSFIDGYTTGDGGAIAVYNSILNLSGDLFDRNSADEFGGAIYASQSTVNVDTSTFSSNNTGTGTSPSGGAAINAQWSDLTVTGSGFTANQEWGFSASSGSSEGGAIRYATPFSNNTLSIYGSTFDGNYAYKGGAVAISDTTRDNAVNVEVSISDSDFTSNNADRGGGFFLENPADPVIVVVKGSTYDSHFANLEGGAMWVGASGENVDLTLSDNTFNHNTADGDGGAVRLDRVFRVDAQRNEFCANSSLSSRGAAVAANDIVDANDWFNNQFVDNNSRVEATFWSEVIHGTNSLAPLNLVSNLFLDNVADSGTSAAARTRSNGGFIENNYFAWNSSFTPALLIANLGGGYPVPTVDYNGWQGNTGGKISYLSTGSTSTGSNAITGAPGFQDYSSDGDCSNNDYRPSTSSRMIDSGDPAYSDPNGFPGVNESTSDIGAWGGPQAPEEDWVDGDGDNWPAMWDCNDDNAPGVNPGATDVCGDGVDADCDGVGLGTDDEDGDTLDYDTEIGLGTDPCLEDSDFDGLDDNVESFFGTNPNLADTDGDSLEDGEEVNVYGTSPLLQDTDTDQIDDGDEVALGSNPLTGDSDADGVSDFDELGSLASPTNTDGDSLPNIIDDDDDGDGILTIYENQPGFGVDCSLSEDCDSDGVLDSVEWSLTGDTDQSTPDDFDEDGDPDIIDTDDDDDTIPTSIEADPTDNYVDDIDGTDGPNWLDLDSDGDGNPDIVEILEVDSDGDGVTDWADPDDFDGPGRDDDFDGSPNAHELIAGTNPFDNDSDDDGVLDGLEIGNDHFNPLNTDGQGEIDALDDDDDNDGVPTWDEDLNGDGNWFNDDTDGDEIPNFRERDDDGDGINSDDESMTEDDDGDGITDWLDGDHLDGPVADRDGDGLDNQTEWDLESDDNSPDSDGDGILDIDEVGDVSNPTDTNGDGIPDIIDSDDDGDGLDTIVEAAGDADGDGVPNYLDPDSDNDGAVDGAEGTDDSDDDGIPDYLDNGRRADGEGAPTTPSYGIGGCTVTPVPFSPALLLILTACASLRRRRAS